MILFRTILMCTVMAIAFASPASVRSDATPPATFTCPVTKPTGQYPDSDSSPFPKDASLHHEDGLWVSVPDDGIIELTPEDVITFGPLSGWRSTTITWLRDEGVEGFVEVSGRRLDAESELAPQTPLSPQRQYVRVGPVTTGLAFPSEGCWEATGIVGKNESTWVVEVRFAPALTATPST